MSQPNPQARQLFDQAVSACSAGEWQRGFELFDRAIAANPSDVMMPNRIGGFLMSSRRLEAAAKLLTVTSQRLPSHAGTFSNLGTVLINMNRPQEAAEQWQKALSLDPDFTSARFNLASLLQDTRQLDRAEAMFRELLARQPGNADALYSLGHIRRDLGDLTEAIKCFERAIEARPHDHAARSALLYSLLFDDRFAWNDIVRRHVELARGFEPPIITSKAGHDRTPGRRLRVGYVSPFLLNHVNAELCEPIFANHDRDAFEIFAYCNAPPQKTHRAKLDPHVNLWRDCERLSDDDLAATIRNDSIDILIDLTSHMAQARAGLFARRVAPVQINYLAYPATSGLRAVDYRVTCPMLDPPGSENPTEPDRLLRLPDTYWCYPPSSDVAIGPPPSERAGHVTFGCLNAFVKVRDACIETWSRVLAAVPGSRMIVLVRGGDASASAITRFRRAGVDPARMTLVDYVHRPQHLDRFNKIDISLDSFPYGGHVTTHDSIWMGVPVVAMTGDSPIARAGACILSHVGLQELVARSSDEYLTIAVDLAKDLPRRRDIRETLRGKMLASPLVDAKHFTRHLEAAYRAAWRRWCERLPPIDIDIREEAQS